MIYVISDLHGCYDEYIKMLNKINFNDNDTLYVLGDICDRGPEPMKILLHMMNHDNIIPIYGNHDLVACGVLSNIGKYSSEVLKDRDYPLENNLMNSSEYREYLYWLSDGGKTTLEDYNHLSDIDKRRVIEYLSDFRYCDEVRVNNTSYVLVHGGLNMIATNQIPDDPETLAYVGVDYKICYFKDKIVISGHTPTKLIDEKYTGKIIKMNNNHIAIDCGCVFGYGLGCLCLDTMEEYYVK